jgi:hypothetical protein
MLMTFHFHNHFKTFSNVSHDLKQGPNLKVDKMVTPFFKMLGIFSSEAVIAAEDT